MRTILAWAICLASTSALGGEVLIDDFDGRATVAPWTFYNGAEFPGAQGNLTLDAGHEGQGAVLAFDFNDGGHYVAAELRLDGGLAPDAIGLWARASAGTPITLRVVDSTGQTLSYNVNRPLAAVQASDWFQSIVELDAPSSFFEGSDTGKLTPPLKELEILAGQPAAGLAQAGAVAFDEVVAVTGLSFGLYPSSVPDFVASTDAGSCRSTEGINLSELDLLDAAEDAGFAFARTDTGWASIETQVGVYDFSGLDPLVAQLASRGMGTLLILDYGNPLYASAPASPGGPPGPPETPTGIEAFQAFAQAAAIHFAGQPVRFEVWNEPNSALYWPPAPDAGWYAQVCQAAIKGAHAGNPAVQITTAGLADQGGLVDVAYFIAELDAGAATGAAAVGIHPYRSTPPETVANDEELLRSLAAPLPVWQTEWGYTAAEFLTAGAVDGGVAEAELQQGLYAAREVLSSCAIQAPMNVDYDMRDTGTDPTNGQDNYGLLTNAGAPKPAFLQVTAALQVMARHAFVGSWSTLPSNLHALKFVGASEVTVALWSDALGGAGSTVVTPVPTSARDGFGNSFAGSRDGGAVSWTLAEVDGPIYLTFAAAPPDGGLDAGLDGGLDGGLDAGLDAGLDGGPDAGLDAGNDAGLDAGADAGPDAGATDAGGSPPATSGCGCSPGGESASAEAAGLLLAVAALGRFQRRRPPLRDCTCQASRSSDS